MQTGDIQFRNALSPTLYKGLEWQTLAYAIDPPDFKDWSALKRFIKDESQMRLD